MAKDHAAFSAKGIDNRKRMAAVMNYLGLFSLDYNREAYVGFSSLNLSPFVIIDEETERLLKELIIPSVKLSFIITDAG